MIDGIITVRTSSKRLKKKCLLKLGNKNILEHVIDRAKHFNINPIVCTTRNKSDDIIANIAKKKKVRFYRGDTNDKLIRWKNACQKFNVVKFITIDADDPFFDGELSKISYQFLNQGYDFIKHSKNQPYNGFYEGCVGYGIKYEILKKACDIKKIKNTEMMWKFIEKVPGIKIKYLDKAKQYKNVNPIRLTLDYYEDYILIRSVFELLGHYATRLQIIKFFLKNPDFSHVNWFRNDDYKKNL